MGKDEVTDFADKIDTMGRDKDSMKMNPEKIRNVVLQQRIIFDLEVEMKSQDKKWGQNRGMDMSIWTDILGEEYGEICRELNENGHIPSKHLYLEIIQTAAVCIQMAKDVRSVLGEKGMK